MRYVKKIAQILILTIMVLAGWSQVDSCKQCDPTAYSTAVGYFTCLATLLIAFICRPLLRKLNPASTRSSKIFFVSLGTLAALYVETILYLAQKITSVPVPSQTLHLIIVMPWYIAMITLLCRSHFRHRYSWPTIALLAGLYQLAADAIMFHHLQGGAFNLSYLLHLPLFFGLFVIIYSTILLPPVWAVEKQQQSPSTKKTKRAFAALLPLAPIPLYWLILYLIYS